MGLIISNYSLDEIKLKMRIVPMAYAEKSLRVSREMAVADPPGSSSI